MVQNEIRLRVSRYNPSRSAAPRFQEYTVPYSDDMVVLDALNYAKDHIDGSLTFRWSCRMGICGSCGVNVNGQPKLACATFVRDLRREGITVEPLSNFPILKDLAVDFDQFLRHLESVTPYLRRSEERPLAEGEYRQTSDQLGLYRQYSLCINCMLCYAACPVYGENPRFLGPAASAIALRYVLDSRDQARDERIRTVSTAHGIWPCTFVGECSVVCPKHVDPAGALQNLKAIAATRLLKSLLLPASSR